MRATYRVRVQTQRPAGQNTTGGGWVEAKDVEADNVAIMGPFIIFNQEKPLRALPGQDPPMAVVYVVSAENLVDLEEVSAELPPPDLMGDSAQEIPDATPVVRAALETDGEVG